MEIEMDKFLSKKQAIFALKDGKANDRYSTNQSIVQMMLKAFYEHARLQRLSTHAMQQIQLDLLFIFSVFVGAPAQLESKGPFFDIISAETKESTSVVNGLFNEAMSSCMARVTGEGSTSLDETLLFTIVSEKLKKL
jgi:hypothetical protein